jgi:hypothetical protein
MRNCNAWMVKSCQTSSVLCCHPCAQMLRAALSLLAKILVVLDESQKCQPTTGQERPLASKSTPAPHLVLATKLQLAGYLSSNVVGCIIAFLQQQLAARPPQKPPTQVANCPNAWQTAGNEVLLQCLRLAAQVKGQLSGQQHQQPSSAAQVNLQPEQAPKQQHMSAPAGESADCSGPCTNGPFNAPRHHCPGPGFDPSAGLSPATAPCIPLSTPCSSIGILVSEQGDRRRSALAAAPPQAAAEPQQHAPVLFHIGLDHGLRLRLISLPGAIKKDALNDEKATRRSLEGFTWADADTIKAFFQSWQPPQTALLRTPPALQNVVLVDPMGETVQEVWQRQAGASGGGSNSGASEQAVHYHIGLGYGLRLRLISLPGTCKSDALKDDKAIRKSLEGFTWADAETIKVFFQSWQPPQTVLLRTPPALQNAVLVDPMGETVQEVWQREAKAPPGQPSGAWEQAPAPVAGAEPGAGMAEASHTSTRSARADHTARPVDITAADPAALPATQAVAQLQSRPLAGGPGLQAEPLAAAATACPPRAAPSPPACCSVTPGSPTQAVGASMKQSIGAVEQLAGTPAHQLPVCSQGHKQGGLQPLAPVTQEKLPALQLLLTSRLCLRCSEQSMSAQGSRDQSMPGL